MLIAPTSFLPSVVDQLFQRIQREFTESGEPKFKKQHHIELYALFGEVATRAFRIIDEQHITVYRHENGIREVIEITDANLPINRVCLFPWVNFCPCNFFSSKVLHLVDSKWYTCEHVLAVRLAYIIDSVKKPEQRQTLRVETLPKFKFNSLLKQFFPLNDI